MTLNRMASRRIPRLQGLSHHNLYGMPNVESGCSGWRAYGGNSAFLDRLTNLITQCREHHRTPIGCTGPSTRCMGLAFEHQTQQGCGGNAAPAAAVAPLQTSPHPSFRGMSPDLYNNVKGDKKVAT